MSNLNELDLQNIRMALSSDIRRLNELGHYSTALAMMKTFNQVAGNDMPYIQDDLQSMKDAINGK